MSLVHQSSTVELKAKLKKAFANQEKYSAMIQQSGLTEDERNTCIIMLSTAITLIHMVRDQRPSIYFSCRP